MVHVKVAGVPTKLVLDTGSTDHVFTRELATRAHLSSTPAEPGTDHAGAAVESWDLGGVEMEIGGESLLLQQVVAIEGPPMFGPWGVGGFLSPQHLHQSGFMVIDLADKKLSHVSGDPSQISAWLLARHPTMRLLSLPREDEEFVAVQASVEPFLSVTTMLNTGSDTEFAKKAVPGLAGELSQNIGHGVGGTQVFGQGIAGQILLVGNARFVLPNLLVREEMSPTNGIVGMDVLMGTVLAISASRAEPIQWLVQPNQ
jgi:hypothetical protein